MSIWTQILAVALLCLPVAVLAARASLRGRAAWEIALAIPLAVSVDLLSVLFAARFVRLEIAVVASRVAWGLALAWVLGDQVRRRRARPFAWASSAVLVDACLAAAIGFALSAWFSRNTSSWDREIHIPLVSAIRAQTLPFRSPYEPDLPIRYHFTGDVIASMLQILSRDRMHAALALSTERDVLFGLIAATVAQLLRAFGVRGRPFVLAGALAPVLTGPCVLRAGIVGESYLGYADYGFYVQSFRPHFPLSGLMMVAIAGVVARGTRRLSHEQDALRAAPYLALSIATMAMTDETSTATIGVALACSWLVHPGLLAPTRKQALAVLAGLLFTVLFVQIVYSGALLGNHASRLELVPWRYPGLQRPVLSLATKQARVALAGDAGPFLAVVLALVIAALRWRTRAGALAAVFTGVVAAISIFGLLRVQVHGQAIESHRFLTAPSFLVPTIGLLCLGAMAESAWSRALVLGALLASAWSTLLWMSHHADVHLTPKSYVQGGSTRDLFAMDCRDHAGASFGEPIVSTYVDGPLFYAYTGCHPVFTAGNHQTHWEMLLHPATGAEARRIVEERLAPDEPLTAACGSSSTHDPTCQEARAGACAARGTDFVLCKARLPHGS